MNRVDLVSCITPTFNRKDLLKRSIRSCQDQTWQNWEMIIVDDGSEDGTEDVVKEIQRRESRIKYFRNPGKGANAARNYGILQSAGDYLVFLDDDDEHLSHRFESQVNAMKASGYDFILSRFQVRDMVTGKVSYPEMQINKGHGAGHGVRWMIRRDLIIRAGLFDEAMPAMQEVELSYRIAKFQNFALHDNIVMSGGINHTSITKSRDRMIRGRALLLEKQGASMLPDEAAWWHFALALDYYSAGDRANAIHNIKAAAEKSGRATYRIAYPFAVVMFPFGGIIKKINYKLLQFLMNYRFPVLVDHQVID